MEDRTWQQVQKAELSVRKAELLISRKEITKAIESLKKAIEIVDNWEEEFEYGKYGDFMIPLVSAHYLLGEVFLMQGEYAIAREHLLFIKNNYDEIEEHWDDLFNDEVQKSNFLLSLIDKYAD